MSLQHMKPRPKKRGELWPRMLVKKWLNIKSRGDEFSADEQDTESEIDDEDPRSVEDPSSHRRRRSFLSLSRGMSPKPEKERTKLEKMGKSEIITAQFMCTEEVRINVGTWNVAGNPPPADIDLDEWLQINDPADIYVLGFQEVVPLNAGNVFGAEDNGPAVKWQEMIRQTLNKTRGDEGKCRSEPSSPGREEISPVTDLFSDVEMEPELTVIEEATSFVSPDSPGTERSNSDNGQLSLSDKPKCVYSRSERIGVSRRHRRTESEPTALVSKVGRAASFSDESDDSDDSDDSGLTQEQPLLTSLLSPFPVSPDRLSKSGKRMQHYVRVASKQMVGIHISVWVRRILRRHIHNLTVSSVGIGLMGYMGNKGSVSVSMLLHQTSFCFICSHLTSGEKEGDELRRNGDVVDILKRTHFPPSKLPSKLGGMTLPETPLAHDRIIWFGDMNYRINMSDRKVRKLVANREWQILLEKDQLKRELYPGRIFEGWCEGPIYFAPTYKYGFNSDTYFGDNAKPGEKKRTPAWCDRVLWYGKGLKVIKYTRTESKLSDHRPVNAVFLAEVQVVSGQKLKEALSFRRNAKVEIEELLSLPETDAGYTSMHLKK